MMRSLVLASAAVLALSAPAFAEPNIVGTYSYSGTETDGSAETPGTLKITAEKSGAYQVTYDDGSYLGVGQIAGNIFAAAVVADGKNTIMIMNINPDGSLSGQWWRRADSGRKATETWVPKK
jgi:hypothetical protein